MLEHFRGCLLGLACGDALSRAAIRRSRAEQSTEVAGAGPAFTGLPPLAEVGPHTELMLCVLESYIDSQGFDPLDVAERFLAWYRAAPRELDWLTREACENLLYGYNFERAGFEAWQALPENMRSGDASLPRCAPTALLRYHDNVHLIGESRVISGITHYDERCKLGCVCVSLAITHLSLVGADGLLDELLEFIEPRNTPLAYSLRAIPELAVRELRCGPQVLDTLQAALWASIYCESIEEGLTLLLARNAEGGSIGAVAGALLGARFGAAGIPQDWLARLSTRERIERGAERLFELGEEQ